MFWLLSLECLSADLQMKNMLKSVLRHFVHSLLGKSSGLHPRWERQTISSLEYQMDWVGPSTCYRAHL